MHPLYFFGNSFSVTLRNFTNFTTILIFLPQGYESLRIMYLLFFSFRRSCENSRIAKKHLLSISVTLRNFHGSRKPACFWFPARLGTSHIVQQRVTSISKQPIKGCISSNNNPWTKLGYDTVQPKLLLVPPPSLNLQTFISSSILHQNTSRKAQSSSFSLLFHFHRLKFTKTSSNDRTIEEEKGIILHRRCCCPSPPRTIRSTHNTYPSLFVISKIIHFVFFRWSASTVPFSIFF